VYIDSLSYFVLWVVYIINIQQYEICVNVLSLIPYGDIKASNMCLIPEFHLIFFFSVLYFLQKLITKGKYWYFYRPPVCIIAYETKRDDMPPIVSCGINVYSLSY